MNNPRHGRGGARTARFWVCDLFGSLQRRQHLPPCRRASPTSGAVLSPFAVYVPSSEALFQMEDPYDVPVSTDGRKGDTDTQWHLVNVCLLASSLRGVTGANQERGVAPVRDAREGPE